jgi:hypothetical protein
MATLLNIKHSGHHKWHGTVNVINRQRQSRCLFLYTGKSGKKRNKPAQ